VGHKLEGLEFRSPIAYLTLGTSRIPLYFDQVWQRRLEALWQHIGDAVISGGDASLLGSLEAGPPAGVESADSAARFSGPPMDAADHGPRLDYDPPAPNAKWLIPDTIANQGNYPAPAYNETFYLATDRLILYFSDGVNWVQINPWDDAYDATGWNGSYKAPTQNAIRDLIESLAATTSGVYTPTLTNVGNASASTAYECQYLRVGNTVVVSGRVDVDPTLTVTSTQLGITIPIASNFGTTQDCAGTAFCNAIAGQGAAIFADTGNDRAQMEWIAGDVTNQALFFIFAYQVI